MNRINVFRSTEDIAAHDEEREADRYYRRQMRAIVIVFAWLLLIWFGVHVFGEIVDLMCKIGVCL